MSLPYATQHQIDTMNTAAELQFGKDPVPVEMPVEVQLESEVADVPADIEVVDIDDQPRIETNKEYNMRMLREGKERAERERDDLLRQLSYQQPKQVAKQEEEPDYLAEMGLDDDSLVEGKHIKAYLKKQRELERQLQQYKSQSSQETVEVRLKHQYPDFDSVVSSENLTSLRTVDPDLADLIINTPDLYKQAGLAYRMVKQYGIYKPVDQKTLIEKATVLKNAAKPRPMAAVSPQQGSSPLSQANAFANGMTADLKANLLREMNTSRKGY